jgi:hypothetical protein
MATRGLVLLFAALCLLAISAPAQAAIGDLDGQSCISKGGAGGCAVLPQPEMLEFAHGVVVAPDGTDVYVGAGAGVAHFRRAPDGSLTYANCVDTDGSMLSRCPASAPPDGGNALSANAIDLAISPDGKFLYAVSWAKALLWWSRDPSTGDLTWGGCRDGASNSATNGHCGTATTFAGGNFPAGAMEYSHGISITPDGKTIYIADQTEGLLQAQRNITTGVATPTDCFNTVGSAKPECTTTAADVPMALSSVDVASNSRDVYVRSISPAGITQFSRTSGSNTSFISCVASGSPSASCVTAAPFPVFSYSGSLGVAGSLLFSEGGNYAPVSGTIGRFSRHANGTLEYESCATTESSPGPCSSLPAQTLEGSIGRLLVSPDASSVYLLQGGSEERALTRLSGSLAFASCLSDTGVAACSPPLLPAPFSRQSGQMVLSPDGKQIYQTAEDTLNIYNVAGQPADTPDAHGQASSSQASGSKKAKAPKIKSLKRTKKGSYRIKVKVQQLGTITAQLTGKLKPKSKAVKLGKAAKKTATKAGTYALVLKPPKAAREAKVRARLVVTLAPSGFLPARASKSFKLR